MVIRRDIFSEPACFADAADALEVPGLATSRIEED